MAYEHSGFQIGLGPVVESLSWHFTRESPYNGSLLSQTSGRVKLSGIAIDAGYHRPFYGPFRFDVRAQLRRFGKKPLPGASYLNAPAGDSGDFLGVGVGVVF